MVKEYEIDAVKFVEISYLVGDDIVNHVQIREGFEPHFTQFKWMSEDYFEQCLDKHFKIKIYRNDKTDIYRCIKK